MLVLRPVVLLAPVLIAGIVAARNAEAQGTQTNVPVSTVMLFSSGVGYFEHAGTMRGDA